MTFRQKVGIIRLLSREGKIINKYKLIQLKKRLLALGLAGVMIGTPGCTNCKNENEEPIRIAISHEYNNIENYYKYIMQNGKATQVYKSDNILLLFNKETYEVSEYIVYNKEILGGLGKKLEVYDLISEEMIIFCDGISKIYNEEYRNYLVNNNYQIFFNEVSDYVEDHEKKDYYSLDEIRKLESQIAESLKIINNTKVKNKTRKQL